jgi:hypothetical protein
MFKIDNISRFIVWSEQRQNKREDFHNQLLMLNADDNPNVPQLQLKTYECFPLELSLH